MLLVTKRHLPSAVWVPHPNIRVPFAPLNSMGLHNAAALPKTLWIHFFECAISTSSHKTRSRNKRSPARLSALTWSVSCSASADWESLDELARPVGTQTCNMSPCSAKSSGTVINVLLAGKRNDITGRVVFKYHKYCVMIPFWIFCGRDKTQ